MRIHARHLLILLVLTVCAPTAATGQAVTELSVPANVMWVDTGVTLAQGQHFKITALGKWSNAGPPTQGPKGFERYPYPGTLLASADLAAMIGKVGDDMFLVGESLDRNSPAAGRLYLSINDTPGTFEDNQGAVAVTIVVAEVPSWAGGRGTATIIYDINYDLKVTSVPQNTTIEFTPVDVDFSVSFKWLGDRVGRPDLIPSYIEVCPALMRPECTCKRFDKPILGRTYAGSVRAMAPPAGKNSELRIVALTPNKPLGGDDVITPVVKASASAGMMVAARYDVAITDFNVITTRSNQEDTIWISLLAAIQSNPAHLSMEAGACKRLGFNWCIFGAEYGDAGDGYHAVPNVRVEAFDLVPEVEDHLGFAFNLFNRGNDYQTETAVRVAEGFSAVGKAIIGAWGAVAGNKEAAGAGEQISALMTKFHDSVDGGKCDGNLASDVQIITNVTKVNRPENTLAALTASTGSVSATLPPLPVKAYYEKDGDFICDRRGSPYQVTYTVYRTSWRPWGWKPTYPY